MGNKQWYYEKGLELVYAGRNIAHILSADFDRNYPKESWELFSSRWTAYHDKKDLYFNILDTIAKQHENEIDAIWNETNADDQDKEYLKEYIYTDAIMSSNLLYDQVNHYLANIKNK